MNIFMFSNGKLPSSEKLLNYGLTAITNCFKQQQVHNVLVIPYAIIREPYDERVEQVRETLTELAVDVKGIHDFSDAVEAIRWADAIMVSGGNTWRLNKMLHDNGLIEPIQNAVRCQNTVYIGWSAGANLCGPNICTTNDMCVVDAAITSSLNFAPFNINPHYIDSSIENHMGESRDERILEFCMQNQHKIVVGIPEGSWLHMSDNSLSYHCPAEKPLTWFKYNHENTSLMPSEDMSFLLDSSNY